MASGTSGASSRATSHSESATSAQREPLPFSLRRACYCLLKQVLRLCRYYREVIIPAGLVLDARFKMTSSGRAMFCG